ncbi:MAG: hypothetical protein B9S30_08005 [Verrucomicrobiia bacterium Tous-C5FEB]|nr:MAG: hypothetical protein B9S30_08005 [Verrucomicrobiae bacterium Tous-C5FEB]
MKSKLIILAAAFGGVLTASGAVYNVTTGTTATSPGIAPTFTGTLSDPAAAALSDFDPNTAGTQAFTGYQNSGIVGFGIFSSLTDAGITGATSLATLYNDFDLFGVTGAFAAGGPVGNRGVFSRNTSETVLGSAFDTKNIYILIGNGATYAASTQLLVLKTAQQFLAAQDDTPTALTVAITTANTSVLFGRNLTDVRTTTADSGVTAGWGTATAVPEPSAALLGALGALGLLRRRRI